MRPTEERAAAAPDPAGAHADRDPPAAGGQAAGDAEARAMAARYARRGEQAGLAQAAGRYSFTRPDVWLAVQQRQRVMLRLFARLGWHDLAALQVLEVGCGAGGNLLELLRIGCAPQHLAGVELLPERFAQARAVLPPAVRLWPGDALALGEGQVAAASRDIVLQSTVFSSILDDGVQQRLAAQMWRWVRPGGGVLWYDFAFDNPRNPDVRGVPLARVRQLFPQARLQAWRVTLAPPLARPLARIHPLLAQAAGAVPWLRTHRLVWLAKPAA